MSASLRRLRWHHGLLLAAVIALPVVGCSASKDEHEEQAPPGVVLYDDGDPPPAPSPEGNVVTYAGTSLGLSAFSANGRIHPHGLPTQYYFEYGPTVAYGSRTPTRSLAPRLAAFYSESWDPGRGGWKGGSGKDLSFVPKGGVGDSGFVRFAEPTAHDYNHEDGIGILHLASYFYPGIFEETFQGDELPSAGLGGRDPDLRDATIKVSVRGESWRPSGTELLWWAQADVTHGKPRGEPLIANWAHTGFFLTDALQSGQWTRVEYRLYNDTTDWTYAGTNAVLNAQLNRSIYVYAPLDDVLSHLDINVFHLLAFVDPYHAPYGAIGFDDIEIAYRNHSLVFPSNGGKLVASPAGSDGTTALTDGHRNGAGKMWRSPPSPQAPLEIVYDFASPVTIQRVQLHQHTEWPSKDIEVSASTDGTTWTSVAAGTIAQSSPHGANFAHFLAMGLAAPAKQLKLRILSGYRPEYWGLGEIEVFGSGATMATDDDWYRVNDDIPQLTRGETYHYRLVAVNGSRTELGGDQTFAVPSSAEAPEAATGRARVGQTTATLEGRLNTLGAEAQVFFEYGASTSYGQTTPSKRAGPEITPRTVVATLDRLTPGSTVHYRLVARGAAGTGYGKDATFVAQ